MAVGCHSQCPDQRRAQYVEIHGVEDQHCSLAAFQGVASGLSGELGRWPLWPVQCTQSGGGAAANWM